jgi:large subunit ribosomal protein L6
MSRIGKMPVPLPSGVDVQTASDGLVTVKGPKGSLSRRFNPDMGLVINDGVVLVQRPNDTQNARALHGLTRSLLNNMVVGVSAGYKKVLEIEGVGFRAAKDGKKLVLALGFSHPVPVEPLEGIEFEVGQDAATRRPFITISGIDKETVGQQAAVIRKLKMPEPYKGKGIRYQGEIVRRKAGKSAKAGGKGGGKGGKK